MQTDTVSFSRLILFSTFSSMHQSSFHTTKVHQIIQQALKQNKSLFLIRTAQSGRRSDGQTRVQVQRRHFGRSQYRSTNTCERHCRFIICVFLLYIMHKWVNKLNVFYYYILFKIKFTRNHYSIINTIKNGHVINIILIVLIFFLF